jgi:hypothetical protein
MNEKSYRLRIKLGEVEIEAEGDKEFIEKHIGEFRKKMPKVDKQLLPDKKADISETQGDIEKFSLAEFYKTKKPKKDVEVVATVGYYLTFHDKKDEFANKDIKNATNQIGHKIANIAHTLKKAAKGKKAYLVKGDKRGSWKITTEGKRFVENELPRKSVK